MLITTMSSIRVNPRERLSRADKQDGGVIRGEEMDVAQFGAGSNATARLLLVTFAHVAGQNVEFGPVFCNGAACNRDSTLQECLDDLLVAHRVAVIFAFD